MEIHTTSFCKEKESGEILLLVAKVVDDLKVAKIGGLHEKLLNDFYLSFELGTVNKVLGSMRFSLG